MLKLIPHYPHSQQQNEKLHCKFELATGIYIALVSMETRKKVSSEEGGVVCVC